MIKMWSRQFLSGQARAIAIDFAIAFAGGATAIHAQPDYW